MKITAISLSMIIRFNYEQRSRPKKSGVNHFKSNRLRERVSHPVEATSRERLAGRFVSLVIRYTNNRRRQPSYRRIIRIKRLKLPATYSAPSRLLSLVETFTRLYRFSRFRS